MKAPEKHNRELLQKSENVEKEYSFILLSDELALLTESIKDSEDYHKVLNHQLIEIHSKLSKDKPRKDYTQGSPPPELSQTALELLRLAAAAGVIDGADPTIESLAPGRLDEMLAALKELERESLMRREGFIDEDPQILVGYALKPFAQEHLGQLSEAALELLLERLDGALVGLGDAAEALVHGQQLERDRRLPVKDEVVEPALLRERVVRALHLAIRRRLGARGRLSPLAS